MMLMAIGLALIAIGLIALLWPEGKKDEIGQKVQQKENVERAKVKGGAIVMIGPVPIIMGSDYRSTILMMLIALAIMIIWVLAFK